MIDRERERDVFRYMCLCVLQIRVSYIQTVCSETTFGQPKLCTDIKVITSHKTERWGCVSFIMSAIKHNYKGWLVTISLGILITHGRETYQPTSRMRWDHISGHLLLHRQDVLVFILCGCLGGRGQEGVSEMSATEPFPHPIPASGPPKWVDLFLSSQHLYFIALKNIWLTISQSSKMIDYYLL